MGANENCIKFSKDKAMTFNRGILILPSHSSRKH